MASAAHVAAARERAAEHADERDGPDREQPAADQELGTRAAARPIRSAARPPSAAPGGDAGQHRADDRRRGLERQPDVGREQPDPEDLEHEDRARGGEDEPGGERRMERGGPRHAQRPSRPRRRSRDPEARHVEVDGHARVRLRPSVPSKSTTVAPRVQRPSSSTATNASTQRTRAGSISRATAHGIVHRRRREAEHRPVAVAEEAQPARPSSRRARRRPPARARPPRRWPAPGG